MLSHEGGVCVCLCVFVYTHTSIQLRSFICASPISHLKLEFASFDLTFDILWTITGVVSFSHSFTENKTKKKNRETWHLELGVCFRCQLILPLDFRDQNWCLAVPISSSNYLFKYILFQFWKVVSGLVCKSFTFIVFMKDFLGSLSLFDYVIFFYITSRKIPVALEDLWNSKRQGRTGVMIGALWVKQLLANSSQLHSDPLASQGSFSMAVLSLTWSSHRQESVVLLTLIQGELVMSAFSHLFTFYRTCQKREKIGNWR